MFLIFTDFVDECNLIVKTNFKLGVLIFVIMAKRKIILNLAMSLDGYIARVDGGFDWIVGDGDKSCNTEKQFSFEKFLEKIDTIIMGRKAYEDSPSESFEMFKSQKVYVVTSKRLESKYDNVEFVNRDILKFVLGLQKKGGRDFWLFGGARLTDDFIKADVIDEYIVGVVPIILGSGRRLFLENNPTIKLHLNECTIQEGVIIMRYSKR